MTSGTLKISSMFPLRHIMEQSTMRYKEHSLWGYLNVRSMTFFKSNARHSRKTAFSVIVYSLSFKYSSVCDMYFLG